MARSTRSCLLLLLLFVLASTAPTSQARKLLASNKISLVQFHLHSLFLAALPRGTTPSSSPTHRGHATLTDQKLLRHLIAADHDYTNRILRSVPSPGVGH